MPIGSYYKGHGAEVMSNMQKEYGDKKGESVFYATANKRGQTPGKAKGGPVSPRKQRSAVGRHAQPAANPMGGFRVAMKGAMP